MTEQEFWRSVDKHGPERSLELGPCWIWQRGQDGGGYGQVWFEGRMVRAHRVAFFLAYGRWPTPCARHRCDTTLCCRPDHLLEGTRRDNNEDRDRRGRQVTPRGDRHGSHTHPESWKRGEAHHARCRPECMPRGEQHGNAKLTEDQIHAIRCRADNGEAHSSIARDFNVDRSNVRAIVARRTWRHIP